MRASQREADYDRAARRANRIREKLGWEPGFLNGHGEKPKGMRWATFERLAAQHDAFVDFIEASFVKPKGMRWATFERLVAQHGVPVVHHFSRYCGYPPGVPNRILCTFNALTETRRHGGIKSPWDAGQIMRLPAA